MKSKIYIYIYIYNSNCGCPRTNNEIEELQYKYGNAAIHGLEKRGEEGMSQKTLRRSRSKEGYEERESVIIGEVSSLE